MSSALSDQNKTWERLYRRICNLLQQFGNEDAFARGDYWVEDENWGHRQQKIYVNNLRLLEPAVVNLLRAQLADFPGWEIRVAVYIPGVGETWPDMGLTIRAHEIIDGLQREFFPKEFRIFSYEDARPGTERD
jgi:hypothetical protein